MVKMFINCAEEINYEHQDLILKILVTFLLKYQGTSDPKYFNILERVVFFAFLIRNDPEKFGEFLIKKMSNFLHNEKNMVTSK